MVAKDLTKIRGADDARTKMLLGQIRRVFDPDYLQSFESGAFTVQFYEDTDARDELVAFAEMHGYEFREFEDGPYKRYYFD